MASAGGCAFTCPMATKLFFADDMGCACKPNASGDGGMASCVEKNPPRPVSATDKSLDNTCVEKCGAVPATCAELGNMFSPMGCAFTCPSPLKSGIAAHMNCHCTADAGSKEWCVDVNHP